ncbi:2-oxo acid dehydrogenase subunit E2, partial [Mycolicibacterium poriferae]|uniref:2-oxo acid dehydrogenase subunit E2 n=1 Tax=Mycolicibacterium poriferae TaxID=39694 RepID=UPI003D2F5F08
MALTPVSALGRATTRLAAGALVAGAATTAYAAWEARHYVLRERTLPVLPAGARPLRVLHLTDLHMTPGQRAKQEWLAGLAGLRTVENLRRARAGAGAVQLGKPSSNLFRFGDRDTGAAARRLDTSALDGVLGVDPDRVPGSGPGGAITIADVDRAASGVATIGSLPAAAHTAAERAQEMRRTIGAAMSRSKHEIPHYYLSDSIPVDAADSWLSEHNAERPVTERILLAVLLVKAVAVAAGRYPEMNGFWTDNQYHPQSGVHVGVAISLRRGGLIAPALRDVGDKSLARIQADLSDLVTRARAGKLRSSEMTDATVTVTNLGDKGGESVF